MKLYSYHRSSASYRVRIALNLKGLDVEQVGVHLVKDGGQQLQAAYREINADGLVPALVDESLPGPAHALTQSLAIIEYLDEAYSEIPLLPKSPAERAYVRSLALSIACDIHPINNLRVLRYLSDTLKVEEEQKNAWYRHWVEQGLAALETTINRAGTSGAFCFGDTPTIADCCLVPQLYNARRFNCELSGLATLLRIDANCLDREAFAAAAPERQPDAA
ncbi:MAG: maleylacetoacetate isomerase [Burkholderiaceae bacterium]|nr:maleylacetoacetate isomerase [Burkholderiaceae bacterium]